MIIGIAAVDLKNGIGNKGQLLFHIKEDLEHFRKLTYNHIVVMGRKTFESIGKPLEGRLNVVLSKNSEFKGCINIHSFIELLDYIKLQTNDIYIIGGASLYEQMLPYYDEIILTKVFAEKEADTFFPVIDKQLELVEKSDIIKTKYYDIQYIRYKRKRELIDEGLSSFKSKIIKRKC